MGMCGPHGLGGGVSVCGLVDGIMADMGIPILIASLILSVSGVVWSIGGLIVSLHGWIDYGPPLALWVLFGTAWALGIIAMILIDRKA